MINIGVQEISPVLKFTGVQIVRDRERRTIMIHQRRYIEQMVSEYASEIKDQESPHGVSKIDRTAFDQMEPGKEGDPHLFDRGQYLRLMGKLVWPGGGGGRILSQWQRSRCELASHVARRERALERSG